MNGNEVYADEQLFGPPPIKAHLFSHHRIIDLEVSYLAAAPPNALKQVVQTDRARLRGHSLKSGIIVKVTGR